jgi:hypothetical protein
MVTFVIALLALLAGIPFLASPADAEVGQLNYLFIDDGDNVSILRSTVSGNVNIPATIEGRPVVSIAERAFSGLSGLRSVTIPDSVTSIGRYAFSSCSSLYFVRLPTQLEAIPDGMFYNCGSLASIAIPRSTLSLGQDAFSQCASLSSIELPPELQTIGSSCFSYCTSLTSIDIPANVTVINSGSWGSFNGCTALRSITVGRENDAYADVDGVLFSADMRSLYRFPPALGGTYSVPDGVTYIDENAFGDCQRLQVVNIPASVESFGGYWPFKGCASLKAIYVNASNMHFTSVNGVLYDKQLDNVIYRPGQDAPRGSSFGFVDVIIFVFVGLAIFAVALPAIFFIWSFAKKGPEGAFKDYMEYKYTQAILNNANMKDDEHKK